MVKVIVDKGKLTFLEISKSRKSETAMAHKNKMQEISIRYNMSEFVMLIALAEIPALNFLDFS